MSADKEHFAPIEEIKPGEAVDLVNRVAAALRLTPGRPQDLGAWERLARKLAERFDGRGDFIGARIAYIESRASQGLPPATRDELAAFADGFAASTPRTAEPAFMIDTCGGKLTTLDQVTGYISRLEMQLRASCDEYRSEYGGCAASAGADRKAVAWAVAQINLPEHPNTINAKPVIGMDLAEKILDRIAMAPTVGARSDG